MDPEGFVDPLATISIAIDRVDPIPLQMVAVFLDNALRAKRRFCLADAISDDRIALPMRYAKCETVGTATGLIGKCDITISEVHRALKHADINTSLQCRNID